LIGYQDGQTLKTAIHEEKEGPQAWSNIVIMQGDITVGGRADDGENLEVDIWYSSVYELYYAGWDLKAYSDMALHLNPYLNF